MSLPGLKERERRQDSSRGERQVPVFVPQDAEVTLDDWLSRGPRHIQLTAVGMVSLQNLSGDVEVLLQGEGVEQGPVRIGAYDALRSGPALG
jgi:hypothetical protein